MDLLDMLRNQFGDQISLEEVGPGTFRVYAPFFHEDGDMYSIYLDTDGDHIVIRDFGNALMRVSYFFDIRTPKQKAILSDIVKSNYGKLDNGELIMHSEKKRIAQSILQYSQLVAKVSNINILRKENVRSMFYEDLSSFITSELRELKIDKDIAPSSDKDLVVDYAIQSRKPIYVFGVLENNKAAKVVITCLTFQAQQIPFRSLIIHENFEGLSAFNRNRLTNTVEKQYTTLNDFKANGIQYIKDELIA